MSRMLSPMSIAFLAGGLLAVLTSSPLHAQMHNMTSRPSMTSMPSMQTHMHPNMMNPSMMHNPRPVVNINPIIVTKHGPWWNRPWWWWGWGWGWNPYWMAGMYGGYGGSGYGTNSESYLPSDSTYTPPPSYKKPATSAPTVPGPSEEERRQQTERTALEQSLNHPPISEITSGKSLNIILAHLQTIAQERGWNELPAMSLDMPVEMLARVNVSRGGGNANLLKQWDRVAWPTALNGPEGREQRKQLGDLLHAAIQQVRANGTVNGNISRQLEDIVTGLQQQLRNNTINLSFDAHREAKSFLKNLRDAITALAQGDAQFLLSAEATIKAKTVPELVKWMTDNGLQFAPASPGDEAAYTTLRARLASYDRSLGQRPAADYKVEP